MVPAKARLPGTVLNGREDASWKATLNLSLKDAGRGGCYFTASNRRQRKTGERRGARLGTSLAGEQSLVSCGGSREQLGGCSGHWGR